ncbi:unannotated protein [freshwater metagenome]|uniref:Unannotated protein n=1 Tax=freshwater metagenome TaxID=449393 RepID=A0A6J7KKQ2_9ZZZZ|nr:DUF3696 domain-containing protein [Actinomycetota bacterium]
MLRNLVVENFKSIGAKVEVDLAPLTIVTGSNSSGKSTLLQCMLVLLQTLRHSSPERQLVLNGPLTQLGDFDDILHVGSKNRLVSIGLNVAPPAPDDDTPQALMRKARVPVFVECQWSFTDRPLRSDASATESKTFPSVHSLAIDGYFESGETYDPTRLRIDRHSWTAERRRAKEGYPDNLPQRSLQSLSWSVKTDPKLSADVRGVAFDHCLPAELTGKFDIQQEMARHLLETVTIARTSDIASPTDWQFFEELWKIVVDRVLSPLKVDSSGLESEPTIAQVRKMIQDQPVAPRKRLTATIRAETETILRQFRAASEPAPWLFVVPLAEKYDRSISAVSDAILNLRYLGPLRVQPAPIYPVATTLGTEDVGPSGEWTASVLDTYKNKPVTFIPPNEIPFSSLAVPQVTLPLTEAVQLWMSYLKVADEVATKDRGSLGHELTVRNSPSLPHLALTHVGVGVSQCLPVVVSLLLAPSHSMTLLEQPELHLHPAVQSRLGDFLLAMTASGRQCFVETHSEYLINRLRRRIAESEGNDVRDQVSLLFAENPDGQSTFRTVEVNEYGAILNWPEGFFDDTQDDIERLLSASHRKRSVNARRN